ncbi:TrkH family potassium uptake protein [Teredinibacter turnerae]|uniref:TrkH family potassium uptake protein n=1 Tax=Teredinibacter turnerae TaxID=2426 RepID=UPI0004003424|nr:potassium transporter TrkG [Teredinibacter turnerae]
MNNRALTLFLLALPLGLMGSVQLVFAGVSHFIFNDHEEAEFLLPALGLVACSLVLLLFKRRINMQSIGYRTALLYAVVTWVAMGVTGAIPIINATGVSFTDGVFESVSALTTTGATVLSGLDTMPKTFLMYRQFLQWLGGLGVVIFVVAVLPMLNVGGMRLLKAETPGPIKDDKLTPRIASTAHYLWLVYLAITLLCALAYWAGGMSLYDAIAHSFTTVSTGGFSTHDASMGYFQSHTLLMISNVFMLAGAINFALHFRVWESRDVVAYWHDEENRVFMLTVLAMTAAITWVLVSRHYSELTLETVSDTLFHVISFITSTGYGASSFTEWPVLATFLLVIAGYMGGCAGSTAGGNKFVRNILAVKYVAREMKRLVHNWGMFSIHYQGRAIENSVLNATMSFLFLTAISSLVFSLVLVATGLDFWSSITAVAACVNVLGPAFGELGSNFQPVNDVGTWVLSLAMILGRLEYFTVLAILSPMFWKR